MAFLNNETIYFIIQVTCLVHDEVVVEGDLGELEHVPHGPPVERPVGEEGGALGVAVHIATGGVGQLYVLIIQCIK